MALKIAKGVWFVSLIIFLAIFFYNYASLGPSVTMVEGNEPVVASKEGVFYGFLSVVALLNMFVFLVNRFFSGIEFKAWFYGLVVTLNAFLAIAINYLALYNSLEKYNYEQIGGIIYGSIVLIVVWLIAWPVYILTKRLIPR
ncbi:MAG: hypothetical protein ACKOC0_07115 [Cytophagales bacterium]